MNREALTSIRAWKSPEWRDGTAQEAPHPAGVVALAEDELGLVLAGYALGGAAYVTSCIPPMCGCPPTTYVVGCDNTITVTFALE